MLGIVCQVCGKRPATSHLLELAPDGGDRQELHICATCIANLELELGTQPPPIASILAKKAVVDEPVEVIEDEADQPTCPVCALTFSEFSANNRFGCAQCYDAFRTHIEPLLLRYHGTSAHAGRLPEALVAGAATARLARRTQLDAALKQAIASEDFERAARLRDELRELDGTAP
jgi:protein arginine kinase activator